MRFFLITNFKVVDITPLEGVISCTDYKDHRVWFTSLFTNSSHILETYKYDTMIFCIKYSELEHVWEHTNDKKRHVVVVQENATLQDILYKLNTDINLLTQAHVVKSSKELALELKSIIDSYQTKS